MWRDLEPDHIVGHVGRLIINDCQSLTLIFLYDNELSSRVLFKKKKLWSYFIRVVDLYKFM